MNRQKRSLSDNQILLMANDYTDSDLTVQEVADKHKVSTHCMYWIIRKLGISKKSRGKEEWATLKKRFEDNKLE